MLTESVLPRLGWAFMVWLLAATAANADDLVVQQIGEVSGEIAEALGSEVTIVPLSPKLDARATPIILAAGKAFLSRRGGRVLGLRAAERRAIRRAYDAGQVILLLDASTHDIEALHLLLDDGVAHESSTDPVVLAYALRQESGVPDARLVTHPAADDALEDDDRAERDLALSRAVEIVIAELTRPRAVPEEGDAVASFPDWGSSPVQATILTSTTNGIYDTPAEVFALHSCEESMDYYLVNTGGDWTATGAQFQSASLFANELRGDGHGNLIIEWKPDNSHCEGGIDIAFFGDERICSYMNYPLSYNVDIAPPSGPEVVQVNAAPAGDQGLSATYDSGLSFSIGGSVDVSGDGPSGGIQAGVSWNNSVSTTVPPLAIDAGDKGEGTFATYKYCTVGSDANCTSTVQMVGQSGFCRQFIVGEPQNGQTPNGRLSNVAQTVYWRVGPRTYTGATFDITVTWTVQLATSTSYLWWGPFMDVPGPGQPDDGPTGYCNNFGCSCSINSATTPITVSHTFKVPLPSSSQCPS